MPDEHSSESAVELATLLAAEVWYPRIADLVTRTIQHCAGDATRLSGAQREQLYRASLEAGDGICADIAAALETDALRRLINSAIPEQPPRIFGWQPHDPELGR